MTEKEKRLFIKQYQWRNYPYDTFPTRIDFNRVAIGVVAVVLVGIGVYSLWNR